MRRAELLGTTRGWAGRNVYVEGAFGVSRTSVDTTRRWHFVAAPRLGVAVPVARGFGIDFSVGAQYRWAPHRGDYVGFAAGLGVVGVPRGRRTRPG